MAANCGNMKKGDVYMCKACGLELQVVNSCTCGSGSGPSCSVALRCCDQDLTKKK